MVRITCRVCGEALERQGTPPVSCLACETSYHVDCWAFNGSKCGVYGCEGRRAIAGLPSRVQLPVIELPAARLVWKRALGPFLAALVTTLALLVLVGAAFVIPWGGLYVGLVAVQVSRLLANTLTWLRTVQVDEDGITFGYVLSRPRKVAWTDVARGPGAGDWTGALQLRNGEIVLMPAGEPGFDEVIGRAAIALSRRDVLDGSPIYIGEDA